MGSNLEGARGANERRDDKPDNVVYRDLPLDLLSSVFLDVIGARLGYDPDNRGIASILGKKGNASISAAGILRRLGDNALVVCSLLELNKDKRTIFEVSSQVGCRGACPFCECGPFRENLEPVEVGDQVKLLMQIAQLNGIPLKRGIQVSFADGGELLDNPNCPSILAYVEKLLISPYIKISTALPKTVAVQENLERILGLDAGLQISLSSTDEQERQRYNRKYGFMTLDNINEYGRRWMKANNSNRKITLSFTLTDKSLCVPEGFSKKVSPDHFVIRLRSWKDNGKQGLAPISDEKIKSLKDGFEKEGFTVIVENFTPFQAQRLTWAGTKAWKTVMIEAETHREIVSSLQE